MAAPVRRAPIIPPARCYDPLAVISVIVPIRNEDPEIAEDVARFSDPPAVELLVADAEPGSAAGRRLQAAGATIVSGSGPRGLRLAEAARAARGDILFFLHADSRAPERALEAISETIAAGAAAGAFSLAYADADLRMRWVAWWANVRSRVLRLPFGDQGLFCRRDAYERAGGFRALPICDDVDLVLRLRRVGPFHIRREKTVTSARRYRERGTLPQVLRNWRVLAGYFAGVPAETLARWYNAEELTGRPRAFARGRLERKAIPRR